MVGSPHRVQVAAAPMEQQIRELDEHDAARMTSAYQRLYTPNNGTNPGGMTTTNAMAPRKSILKAQNGGERATNAKIPHHQGIVINNDDDDEDEDEADDDEENSAAKRAHRGRVASARSSTSSTSTAMLLSESNTPWQTRMNPSRDLNKITNRFQDERLEESYQLYSSTCDFPVARRIMLFLLAFEVGAYLLFLYLKHSCAESQAVAKANMSTKVTFATTADESTQATGCFSYDLREHIDQGYIVLLWLFSPFAFLYGLIPLKYFESSMRLRIGVYYIRRRWKEIATVVILLWSIGLAIFMGQTLTKMRSQFQTRVFRNTTCGRNLTVPVDWYEDSNWKDVNKALYQDHGMNVREWIYVYDSKVAYSVIVAVLAALSALVGIMSVSMKLDFTHVLVVCFSQAVTTLILVVTGPSMSQNSDIGHKVSNQTVLFMLCVVMPVCVTLIATYSEDRAARTAYVSKIRAERINTTLKLDLSVKRNGLENMTVGDEEKEAMEEALGNEDDMALCQSVAIPFTDLNLKDILAKGPSGDILLAQYHGTSVVFKRLAVSSLTPEGLKHFKVRVELLTCLRHPNVVQFIGATFDNLANVGLVLEYLERGDVLTLLRGQMTLTWSDPLLKIATDVAQGMTYLHNCDPPLVHRDLKTSNLLCTPTYSCKISDFGESKRYAAGVANLFSTIVGTPYWMAPEIIREEKYDMQVDCYSFGIVLIELETRKDPYFDLRDYNTVDIMMLVAHENLRPTIPASCSPFRRQLITRCLDADPRRRPKMSEILSMLQNEVRQELLDQNSIDNSSDKRRLMLMQRHQMLNRRGVSALMLADD